MSVKYILENMSDEDLWFMHQEGLTREERIAHYAEVQTRKKRDGFIGKLFKKSADLRTSKNRFGTDSEPAETPTA
jgi:hypothetical protein